MVNILFLVLKSYGMGGKRENKIKIVHFSQWPQEGDREPEVAAGSGSGGGHTRFLDRWVSVGTTFVARRFLTRPLQPSRAVYFTAHAGRITDNGDNQWNPPPL